MRMQAADAFGALLVRDRPYQWTDECPVEALIDVREMGNGCEAPIVLGVVSAEGANVTEPALLEPNHLLARSKLRMSRVGSLLSKDRLVQPGWQDIDQIHGPGEFVMLLRRDLSRDEDAEMTDALV